MPRDIKRYQPGQPITRAMMQALAHGSVQSVRGPGVRTGGNNITLSGFQVPPGVKIFPVDMDKQDGAAGDASTQCAYRYQITDTLTSVILGTYIDPTVSPGRWACSPLGAYLPATAGEAFLNSDGDLVIMWCNEVPNAGPCTPP